MTVPLREAIHTFADASVSCWGLDLSSRRRGRRGSRAAGVGSEEERMLEMWVMGSEVPDSMIRKGCGLERGCAVIRGEDSQMGGESPRWKLSGSSGTPRGQDRGRRQERLV